MVGGHGVVLTCKLSDLLKFDLFQAHTLHHTAVAVCTSVLLLIPLPESKTFTILPGTDPGPESKDQGVFDSKHQCLSKP